MEKEEWVPAVNWAGVVVFIILLYILILFFHK